MQSPTLGSTSSARLLPGATLARRSGYLRTLQPSNQTKSLTWKTRWVTVAHGRLLWFKEKDQTNRKGGADVRGARVEATVSTDVTGVGAEHRHSFIVQLAGTPDDAGLVFAAMSDKDKADWSEAIAAESQAAAQRGDGEGAAAAATSPAVKHGRAASMQSDSMTSISEDEMPSAAAGIEAQLELFGSLVPFRVQQRCVERLAEEQMRELEQGGVSAAESGRISMASLRSSRSSRDFAATAAVGLAAPGTTAAVGAILKAGWMMKKGQKRHNWKRRWFVLAGGSLLYFDRPEDVIHNDPKDMMFLAGFEVQDAQRKKHHVNSIALVTDARELLLMCESEEDKAEWKTALAASIVCAHDGAQQADWKQLKAADGALDRASGATSPVPIDAQSASSTFEASYRASGELERKRMLKELQTLWVGLPSSVDFVELTFVKRGTVEKVNRYGRLESVVLYLFEELCLYGSTLHMPSSYVKYRRGFQLEDAQCSPGLPGVASEGHSALANTGTQAGREQEIAIAERSFTIHTASKSFVLAVDSTEDRDSWVDAMERCIAKVQEKAALRTQRAMSGAQSPGGGPRVAPVWTPDHKVSFCQLCYMKFTTLNRRHHCRFCGLLTCAKCSTQRKQIPGEKKAQRMCDRCHETEGNTALGLHQYELERFSGSVIFADVSGFSKLGARLQQMEEERVERQGRNRLAREISRRRKSSVAGGGSAAVSTELDAEDSRTSYATGAEELTKVLGGMLEQMVEHVAHGGGDVIKFAGDCVIAVFPSSEFGGGLAMAVCQAAACALSMLTEKKKWVESAALDSKDDQEKFDLISGLDIHIAIGAGMIYGYHVGGVKNKWEYLISGPAMVQVRSADEDALPGWVVMSAEAHDIIRNTEKTMDEEVLPSKNVHFWTFFGPSESENQSFQRPWELCDTELRGRLCETLQAYVPAPLVAKVGGGQTLWISEQRRLSVLFVKLLGVDYSIDRGEFALLQLQAMVSAVQHTLATYEGTLTRVISDDKGTSMLITFGLPPFAHVDDTTRALHAALDMNDSIRNLCMSDNEADASQRGVHVGVTSGLIFCGAVGGSIRSEFTMHGSLVNFAARLMTAKFNTGVLCDHPTYRLSQEDLSFSEQPAHAFKGFAKPVVTYRPERKLHSIRGSGRSLNVTRSGRNLLPNTSPDESDAWADRFQRLRASDGQGVVVVIQTVYPELNQLLDAVRADPHMEVSMVDSENVALEALSQTLLSDTVTIVQDAHFLDAEGWQLLLHLVTSDELLRAPDVRGIVVVTTEPCDDGDSPQGPYREILDLAWSSVERPEVEVRRHGGRQATTEHVSRFYQVRIDQLPTGAQTSLKVASVLASSALSALASPQAIFFSTALARVKAMMSMIGSTTAEVVEHLSHLQKEGIIVPADGSGADSFGGVVLAFAENRTQQIAYESLLHEDRIQIHSNVVAMYEGLALESKQPGAVVNEAAMLQVYAVLATHCLEIDDARRAAYYRKLADGAAPESLPSLDSLDANADEGDAAAEADASVESGDDDIGGLEPLAQSPSPVAGISLAPSHSGLQLEAIDDAIRDVGDAMPARPKGLAARTSGMFKSGMFKSGDGGRRLTGDLSAVARHVGLYISVAETPLHASADPRSEELGVLQAGEVVDAIEVRWMSRTEQFWLRFEHAGQSYWASQQTEEHMPLLQPLHDAVPGLEQSSS